MMQLSFHTLLLFDLAIVCETLASLAPSREYASSNIEEVRLTHSPRKAGTR